MAHIQFTTSEKALFFTAGHGSGDFGPPWKE